MTLRKAFEWSLYAFVFCIPVLPTFNVKVLIVCLAISLFVKDYDFPRLFYRTWDLALYILVLLIGLLYTDNIDRGWAVLESSFSLLAIPLIFSKFSSLKDEGLNKLYYAFALGLLAACLITLGNAAYQYSITQNVQAFFFYRLTEVINSHPTYLAYYLIFGLTVALFRLYYDEGNVPRGLLIVLIVFFFFMLTLTGGSTAFVSLLLIMSFFILKYTLEPSTRNKRTVLVFVCGMMALLFFENTLSYLDDQFALESDYWERSDLWKAAIRANFNPFFGVGTGDYSDVLNQYYRTHGLEEFAEKSFNSHNQFVAIYLSNGILGVIAVVTMMIRPIYLALRNQFTIGILIFFPFLIYGMNEVILGRYQGIVFFALMHQLFITYYASARPAMRLKAG